MGQGSEKYATQTLWLLAIYALLCKQQTFLLGPGRVDSTYHSNIIAFCLSKCGARHWNLQSERAMMLFAPSAPSTGSGGWGSVTEGCSQRLRLLYDFSK